VRVLENSFEAANMYLKREEVVSRIRAFLSAAKLANYEIPEEMQKVQRVAIFFLKLLTLQSCEITESAGRLRRNEATRQKL
jgi:hypothetical protein